MMYSIQLTSAIGLYPKTNLHEKQIIAMEHAGMEKRKVILYWNIKSRD